MAADTQGVVLRLLLPAILTATLMGAASLGEAQAPQGTSVIDGAHRGYLAIRLLEGGQHEVIDELNAGGFFVPASVLKVITVAASLEHLGADYQWLTRLMSQGATTGGVLDGDLVIEPGADPTWSADLVEGSALHPLAMLAQQVRAGGVTRISGDLVVDASHFPGRPHPIDRSFGDLPFAYGTPPAALAVNDATITVRVAPGASVGEPARVTAPDGIDVINVINHTVTVGRDRHGGGTLDFVPVWGTNTLLLRGEYPISEGAFAVSASDPAPELRVAHRLRTALTDAGVTVEGGVRVGSRAHLASSGRAALAELRSRPLADLLETILTESHNWYADMLILTMSREVAGSGRFEEGVEVVSDFASSLDPGGRIDFVGDNAQARLGTGRLGYRGPARSSPRAVSNRRNWIRRSRRPRSRSALPSRVQQRPAHDAQLLQQPHAAVPNTEPSRHPERDGARREDRSAGWTTASARGRPAVDG